MELSGAFEYCNVFYSHRWLSFPFVPRSSWVFPPYSCDSCLVRWDRQWCLHHSNNSTFFFLKCSKTPRTITQSIRLHQTATPPHLKPAAGLWLALGCYLKLLREEELANRSHATANVEAVWHLACTTVGCLPMEVWRNRVTVCNRFLRYKGGHTSGLLISVVCLHSPMLWSSDITIMHIWPFWDYQISWQTTFTWRKYNCVQFTQFYIFLFDQACVHLICYDWIVLCIYCRKWDCLLNSWIWIDVANRVLMKGSIIKMKL